MNSYMESDYAMKFEVYDYDHDIAKTHTIFIKEPDMKPHGCSTKNPSTIRAHVIIMKFLETIHDYFKANQIRCRMDDILDVLFNSAPGILRSPTINLTNFDYNYKSNQYRTIQFILEDKQVCYSDTFYILAILDHDIKPDANKVISSNNIIHNNGKDLINEDNLKKLMTSSELNNPIIPTIRDNLIREFSSKIENNIRADLSKKRISKAALNELVATRLVVRDQVITTKDDTNKWDTFLNEMKMERLHKDDDTNKYFYAPIEILDRIDVEDCHEVMGKYTASNDKDAIQRGLILLGSDINKLDLNNKIDIAVKPAIANYKSFLVVSIITIGHGDEIDRYTICKYK